MSERVHLVNVVRIPIYAYSDDKGPVCAEDTCYEHPLWCVPVKEHQSWGLFCEKHSQQAELDYYDDTED